MWYCQFQSGKLRAEWVLEAVTLRGFAGLRSAGVVGRTDWVYWSLTTLSVASLGWSGATRFQLSQTVQRAQTCLAQQDVPCATQAVATLTERDPDPSRAAIAQANLYVLLGDLEQSAKALGHLKEETHTRGDYLLAQGDLLMAQRRWQQARERFEAARGVVADETLLAPRLTRLEQAEEALQRDQSTLVASLRTHFDELFEASSRADRDGVYAAQRAIRELEGRIPQEPRRKLREAHGWAAQALSKATRRDLARRLAQPRPSRTGLLVPPNPGALNTNSTARQSYLERRARAEQAAQRVNEAAAQQQREQSLQATKLSLEVQEALAKARSALQAGLDELNAVPPTSMPQARER